MPRIIHLTDPGLTVLDSKPLRFVASVSTSLECSPASAYTTQHIVSWSFGNSDLPLGQMVTEDPYLALSSWLTGPITGSRTFDYNSGTAYHVSVGGVEFGTAVQDPAHPGDLWFQDGATFLGINGYVTGYINPWGSTRAGQLTGSASGVTVGGAAASPDSITGASSADATPGAGSLAWTNSGGLSTSFGFKANYKWTGWAYSTYTPSQPCLLSLPPFAMLRAEVASGHVAARRAEIPGFPYAGPWNASGGTTDSEPALFAGGIPHGTHLLFTRGTSGVYETVSYDRGETWSTPAMAFSGGKHPQAAVSRAGTVLRAAYVSGKLHGTLQPAGAIIPGAEFTFKDDVGADLTAADDSFGLHAERLGLGRWWLSLRYGSETSVSDWFSSDGMTWTRGAS